MKKPAKIPQFQYWCEIDGDGHGYLIEDAMSPSGAAEEAVQEQYDEIGASEKQMVSVEDWMGNKFEVEVYTDWEPSFIGFIQNGKAK